MTAKKDLKRRIRERQAETGESYVTARRHVLAKAPAPVPAAPPDAPRGTIVVEEMADLTPEAETYGFRCRIMTTAAIRQHLDCTALLQRFRDILLGTTEDPAMELMRGVALRGAPRPKLPRRSDAIAHAQRFMQRARVGIGGITDDGTLLAFPFDTPNGSVMILANIGWRPIPLPPTEKPRVVFSMLSSHDVPSLPASLLYIR